MAPSDTTSRFFGLVRSIVGCLAIFLAIIGCTPTEVVPDSIDSDPSNTPKSAPNEVVGSSKLTHASDKISIAVPPEFLGTALTDAEIEQFSSRIAKVSESLAAQVRSQCTALRPAGGSIFALNISPGSVAEGFADNMNVSIRGLKSPIDYAAMKVQVIQGQKQETPNAQIKEMDLAFKGRQMLELRIDRTEVSAGKPIQIAQFVYAVPRNNQIVLVSFACAGSRAPKMSKLFRASALSLELN